MSEDVVWLDVLPAMDKFGPALTKGADKEASKAGGLLGSNLGKGIMKGLGALGIAFSAGAIAKSFWNIGATFDEVTDTIRAGTGATGESLDALVASAKSVGTRVPAEFEAIGTMVADVNTRLGLTGDTLETFASQALEAGRVMGEEIDINAVSGAFSAFRIEGEDTIDAMDHLFRVSQATGVGMNELANNASRSAPAMQALGFSFEETTALVGNLDKAGLDSSKMMAGMSRALVSLAKDGEEPEEAFKRVTGEIQGFMEEGNKAAAVDLAAELFGTRNASQFIGALESGALNMAALNDVAGMTEDTILGVGQETMDFSEHWQIFGNQMSTLVAPIAEKVFGLISQGMQWINDNAIPWIDRMTESWRNSEGSMGQIRDVFERVWAFAKDNLVPIFMTFVDYVRTNVIPFVERLVGVVSSTLIPIFQDVWALFRDRIIPILKNVADFIVQNVVPVIKNFAEKIALPLFKAVGDAVTDMWKVAKPVLEFFYQIIEDYVGPAISWLWDSVVEPTFKWIGDAIERFGDKWGGVWNGIKAAAAAPVNFVINTIWNDGLRKVLNLIPGVNLGAARPIPVPTARSGGRGGGGRALAAYRDGGLIDLPWSASNRDPYIGVTASGGLFRFEGEEFLVNREQARKHRRLLEAINAGDFHLPGYQRGGVIRPVPQRHSGWNGGRYRSGGYHGGLDFPAPTGTPISAMWPGTVARALRLNRSYGHHAILDHGGGLQTLYAHMSQLLVRVGQAITGGGRVGLVGSTGNSTGPHLHLEVRRNGARVNPEPYLSGAASGPDTLVPDGKGGWIDLLKAIPSIFRNIQSSLNELVGPWGAMVLGAAKSAVSNAVDFVVGKVPGLGRLLNFLNVGRGYAAGTSHAHPGLAWVGERGPELVRFRGGERVWDAQASSRLSAARAGNTQHITLNVPREAFRDVNSFLAFVGGLEVHAHTAGGG